MGEIGYKERVNFGEKIGIYINKNIDGVVIAEKETNTVIIHYKQSGNFHAVPAKPS